MNSDSKTVLITGAARRIGAVTAQLFHAAGYNVVIHYNRSAAAADRLCEQFNAERTDSCLLVQSDLNDMAGLNKIVDLMQTVGRLDVLINNASSFYPTPLEHCDEQQWDDLIASNLKGPFFLAQKLAPMLVKAQGAIVNISDMHARQALRNHPIYTVAKAGNIAFERWTPDQVRATHPNLMLRDDEAVGHEPTAGLVLCERAVAVQVQEQGSQPAPLPFPKPSPVHG